MNRRFSEAAQRFAERRRREDEAPRLATLVPALANLQLEFRESRAGGQVAEVAHKRRVVVDRAPALFEVPCQDTSCKDGGHDLTHEIVERLRSGAVEFSGEDGCHGRVGTANCARVLAYSAVAEYRK
jgi:hypothetical protein